MFLRMLCQETILGADAAGRLGSARTSLHLLAAIMTLCWGCGDLGAMLDPSWAMLGPCYRATWSSVGTTSAHVRSKLTRPAFGHLGTVLKFPCQHPRRYPSGATHATPDPERGRRSLKYFIVANYVNPF